MCFLNCKEKTYFKEIISERKVNIAMAEFPRDKEDFVINIPLEFNLLFNNFSWFVFSVRLNIIIAIIVFLKLYPKS